MEARLRFAMAHYIAIIEDTGPDTAIGIWFPDLPGCFSAGDDIDQAMRNAPEALELFAEAMREQGKVLPRPRSLTELKTDPEVAADLDGHIVALIELRAPAHAAE
jgi:predicted RNase H-like HicB family nuclease